MHHTCAHTSVAAVHKPTCRLLRVPGRTTRVNALYRCTGRETRSQRRDRDAQLTARAYPAHTALYTLSSQHTHTHTHTYNSSLLSYADCGHFKAR